MDLELQEVANLLQVSHGELLRWAENGKVPAYFINNTFRFNRQEIEAWVLQNQQKNSSADTPDDKENHKQTGSLRFNLYRALNTGDVFADIEAKTPRDCIQNTVRRLAKPLGLDVDTLTELFMDREKLVPTAVGNGFAIPHARDFLLNGARDVVACVFLQKPIEWKALDGMPVHTLFFLLAADDKRHLALLSKIAHLTCSESLKQALLKRPGKAELLELIKEWEGSLS